MIPTNLIVTKYVNQSNKIKTKRAIEVFKIIIIVCNNLNNDINMW